MSPGRPLPSHSPMSPNLERIMQVSKSRRQRHVRRRRPSPAYPLCWLGDRVVGIHQDVVRDCVSAKYGQVWAEIVLAARGDWSAGPPINQGSRPLPAGTQAGWEGRAFFIIYFFPFGIWMMIMEAQLAWKIKEVKFLGTVHFAWSFFPRISDSPHLFTIQ